MGSGTSSGPDPTQPRRAPSPSWISARALWAGLSIMTMWLAVLFAGIFGQDIASTSAGGATSVPVVVLMLPFVLPATIAVARRGFTASGTDERYARIEQAPAAEGREEEPLPLRAKVA